MAEKWQSNYSYCTTDLTGLRGRCPDCDIPIEDTRLWDISDHSMKEATKIFHESESYVRALYGEWNERKYKLKRCPKCGQQDGRHSGRGLCSRCARLALRKIVETNASKGIHPYADPQFPDYRGGLRLSEIPEPERKDKNTND